MANNENAELEELIRNANGGGPAGNAAALNPASAEGDDEAVSVDRGRDC